MKMKVYIAGSISKNPNYKEQFKKAEEILVANGCAVMSPAILPEGFTQEDYMTVCISMINVCNVTLFLDGWEKSTGAKVEHMYCDKIEKPIFYEDDIEYLGGSYYEG